MPRGRLKLRVTLKTAAVASRGSADWRSTHRLADHPQDVVQWIAVAVQVEH
jgi:hypothetical protein